VQCILPVPWNKQPNFALKNLYLELCRNHAAQKTMAKFIHFSCDLNYCSLLKEICRLVDIRTGEGEAVVFIWTWYVYVDIFWWSSFFAVLRFLSVVSRLFVYWAAPCTIFAFVLFCTVAVVLYAERAVCCHCLCVIICLYVIVVCVYYVAISVCFADGRRHFLLSSISCNCLTPFCPQIYFLCLSPTLKHSMTINSGTAVRNT